MCDEAHVIITIFSMELCCIFIKMMLASWARVKSHWDGTIHSVYVEMACVVGCAEKNKIMIFISGLWCVLILLMRIQSKKSEFPTARQSEILISDVGS